MDAAVRAQLARLASMTRIVVLTEEALATADVAHIIQLHTDAEFRVMRARRHRAEPPGVDRRPPEPRRAARGAGRGATTRAPVTPELTAAEQLEQSLAAFAAAGAAAVGEVVEDDPLPALAPSVAEADEVLVVTTPHALEDTFHTDWASRAREELHVPVMHLYAAPTSSAERHAPGGPGPAPGPGTPVRSRAPAPRPHGRVSRGHGRGALLPAELPSRMVRRAFRGGIRLCRCALTTLSCGASVTDSATNLPRTRPDLPIGGWRA